MYSRLCLCIEILMYDICNYLNKAYLATTVLSKQIKIRDALYVAPISLCKFNTYTYLSSSEFGKLSLRVCIVFSWISFMVCDIMYLVYLKT